MKKVWSLKIKDNTIWEWKNSADNQAEEDWIKIGWDAKAIFCDSLGKLYNINKRTGAVWSYDGEPMSWTLV